MKKALLLSGLLACSSHETDQNLEEPSRQCFEDPLDQRIEELQAQTGSRIEIANLLDQKNNPGTLDCDHFGAVDWENRYPSQPTKSTMCGIGGFKRECADLWKINSEETYMLAITGEDFWDHSDATLAVNGIPIYQGDIQRFDSRTDFEVIVSGKDTSTTVSYSDIAPLCQPRDVSYNTNVIQL